MASGRLGLLLGAATLLDLAAALGACLLLLGVFDFSPELLPFALALCPAVAWGGVAFSSRITAPWINRALERCMPEDEKLYIEREDLAFGREVKGGAIDDFRPRTITLDGKAAGFYRFKPRLNDGRLLSNQHKLAA